MPAHGSGPATAMVIRHRLAHDNGNRTGLDDVLAAYGLTRADLVHARVGGDPDEGGESELAVESDHDTTVTSSPSDQAAGRTADKTPPNFELRVADDGGYQVVWTIDIGPDVADNPREAAERAWYYMRKRNSTANAFTVFDGTDTHEIDLSEPEDPAIRCSAVPEKPADMVQALSVGRREREEHA